MSPLTCAESPMRALVNAGTIMPTTSEARKSRNPCQMSRRRMDGPRSTPAHVMDNIRDIQSEPPALACAGACRCASLTPLLDRADRLIMHRST